LIDINESLIGVGDAIKVVMEEAYWVVEKNMMNSLPKKEGKK
jgi:mannitol-1-phosphate/altronate dehydrogenase